MTTKFATITHAIHWQEQVFDKAARILRGELYEWRVTNPATGREDYVRVHPGREWFLREYNRYPLHRAVCKMMNYYKPDDWQQLLLEWPHKSVDDPNRIAYTRDERGGEQDRQVVTSIGKYLHRHFRHAPDDMIRDVVAEFSYSGGISFVKHAHAMRDAVINGPRSCMSKTFDILGDDGAYYHPYEVYCCELGWSMAVRKDGDTILGRCLVLDSETDGKGFVRSYKRERNESSSSGADEAIEAHLKGLGYTKWGGWPEGAQIRRLPTRRGGIIMPYIDGCNQRVAEHHNDSEVLVIDDDGMYQADNTDGVASEHSAECEHCGARYDDESEGGWVGRHEDMRVCQDCIDNEYTYAYGYRGRQYYVHNNDIVEVDGEYYHDEYLSDNSIVQLHDGEYCHQDNAVWIESVDEYYDCDDDDICYDEDAGEYDLKSNCWQCEESGNWYNDGVDYVEIDGCKYHPDHAPETETQDDETN